MTTQAIAKKDDANIYESLALHGDLSGLKPEEKAQYYSALCNRLGLDPATQPFALIKLNGKEVMYAKRDATDQLARIHNVNRQIVKEEHIAEAYVVTVEATLPNGRKEQSKGAVTLGQLKGDAFCNAIMKAETKAKRRATLSILGLGMLDEGELETIPDYHPQPPTKGELIAAATETVEPEPDKKSVSALIKELNAAGDSIEWNKQSLLEYAQVLFDDDTITDLKTLTEEQQQFLGEDLTERLDSLR